MIWNTAFSIIEKMSQNSCFGIVLSYTSEIRLIKKFKLNMEKFLLISDGIDDFISEDIIDFDVIPSNRLFTLDKDRSFHPKIFLFGENLSENKIKIKYLIGSCNSTFKGLNSNIEFYFFSEFIIDNKTSFDLFSILSNGNYNPTILEDLLFINDSNEIGKSILDFIIKVVNEASGNDVLKYAESDHYTIGSIETYKKITFVHSLDNNSLYDEYKNQLEKIISQCSKLSQIKIISPYLDKKMLINLNNLIMKQVTDTYKKVKIKILTNYPPDYSTLYSTGTFVNLNEVQFNNEYIDFEYKYWTNQSTLLASEIFQDEQYKDIKNRFLHGKLIFCHNDSNNYFVILGSPNYTTSALNPSPRRNIECGLVFRDDEYRDNFNVIFDTLWDASENPNEKMIKYLEQWTKEIENLNYEFDRMDAEDLFENSIKTNILLNGKKIKKELELNNIQNYKIELIDKNDIINSEINNIKMIFLTDGDQKKWENECYISDGRYMIDIAPKEFKLKSCRIHYKLILTTKLKRQIEIKNQSNINELLKQDIYGVKYKNIEKNKYFPINKNTKIGKNNKLLFRLYNKQPYDVSLGWNSLSVCKIRPQIIPELAINCGSAICIKVKEKRSKKHSTPIENTINISILNKNDTANLIKVTKINSFSPFNARYFYISESNPQNEFKVKISFLDKDSKYRNKSKNYKTYNITECSEKCDFKKDAIHFIDYCDGITYNNEVKSSIIVDRAPFSIVFNLPYDSYLYEKLGYIIVQCNVPNYGPLIHYEYQIPIYVTSNSLTLNIDPLVLLQYAKLNKQDLKLTSIKIKMVLVLKSGWRYEFGSTTLDILNTEQYLKRHFANIWDRCNESITNKNEFVEKMLHLIYEELVRLEKKRVKSFENFYYDYQWGFQSTGEIGRGSSKGFLFNEDEFKKISLKISNDLVQHLYKNFKSNKFAPNLSFEIFKEELLQIILKKIYDESFKFENNYLLVPRTIIEPIIK